MCMIKRTMNNRNHTDEKEIWLEGVKGKSKPPKGQNERSKAHEKVVLVGIYPSLQENNGIYTPETGKDMFGGNPMFIRYWGRESGWQFNVNMSHSNCTFSHPKRANGRRRGV